MHNNLAYTVHPGSGPYLLLAHGMLSNSAQWLLNLAALAEVCTPVTVELFGHGSSPSPDDPTAYEPDAYVDHFEHIRQQLDTERWLLCGYSLSAGLTIRYALQYPQHVYGHMLTNSLSAFATAEVAREWQESSTGSARRAATDGVKFFNKMAVHPRFATTLPKAVYTPLLERTKLLDPVGASHTLAVTVPRATVRDRVSKNQRPALLLHGVREKRFTEHAEFAAREMPQLQVEPLQAGHAVNMQAAEEFNARVSRFIRECLAA